MSIALCAPFALAAAPVVIEIRDYAVATGTRADYFDGKLLTEGSLSGDQQYLLGAKRYLGDPVQVLGDSTVTLYDLAGTIFTVELPKAPSASTT